MILVTGGAGYIGTHTLVALIEQGFELIVLDNFCNSKTESLKRVEQITGKAVPFAQGDIRDAQMLDELFSTNNIDSVIHFAALKAVGESVAKPLEYYHNNVFGTVQLLQSMQKHSVHNFVFSSSATVYGEESEYPYKETMKLGTPTSPYGNTKLVVEKILMDMCQSNRQFRAVSLRYFNPIGAHPSGLIGEDPNGIPNNLMPFISQVAIGKRDELSIFGNDYATNDGTCERDYLHVVDLANGHVDALNWLNAHADFTGYEVFNLGTGTGLSVMQMVNAFQEHCGVAIPYKFAPRRNGDLPAFWADATKANTQLNWSAQYTLKDMMVHTWNWQEQNPQGYSD